METKILSIQEAKNGTSQVRVEHPQGGIYIIGFYSTIPLLCEKEYSQAICTITDNFIKLERGDYFNYLSQQLGYYGYEMPMFAGQDRNLDRERIGHRIKALREEKQMDAKSLAQKAGITPANMSRIEQGKYSPGLDILCRIASALGMQLDFVKKGGA
ncbi:MAG: helix-turn-helix domain-containing protein [Bacteroidales bacterium]|nr:helix-turn-helix domain-containing protein [Bacteroidales bacterium]